MAALQQEPSGTYHVVLYHKGRRFKRSLWTKSHTKAESEREEMDATYLLVRQGRIDVPEHVSIVDFVLAKGKLRQLPEKDGRSPCKRLTLTEAFDLYFASIPAGSLENGSLKTMGTHRGNLERHLKPNFMLRDLNRNALQAYALSAQRRNRRVSEACRRQS